jgi:membrane-associated phospholipid phosphatase
MISWSDITSLGSFSVMAPAAAAITAWLILGRAWRLVLWWCELFIGGMTLVVATKIAFIGWGLGIRSIDFTGFSGHVMRATSVAPVLIYLVLQKTPRFVRFLGVLSGLAFGVIIAVSRLEVHAHSLSETVTGWILGAMVSISFIWILAHHRKVDLHSWFIALSLLALLATPYIEPTPTQRWITNASLNLSGHTRPYIRATWKMAPMSWRPANIDEVDP